MIVIQNDVLSNKLSQILQIFPIDHRRHDGMPNPANVRLVQVLINLILNRIQRDHGDIPTLSGTQIITFCLQGDRRKGNKGWQGIIEKNYPGVNRGIDALRAALRLIEEMGSVIWRSQGRHREGLLYCCTETLLLIDQACMILLEPDMEPVRGDLGGDEQLSDDYWHNAPVAINPLRSCLKWIGAIARRVFGQLPRKVEVFMDYCADMVEVWYDTHQIITPARLIIPDCEVGFAWVII